MAKNDSGMIAKDSGTIARKSRAVREKTRFPGVYSRSIINKRTGKPDVAFDICYRDREGKFRWELIGYNSEGVNAGYANKRRGAILEGFTKGDKPKATKEKALTFGAGWAIFDEKWLPNLASPDDERNRFRRYLEEPFAHRKMDAITLMELEGFKQELLQRGLAAATVRLALGDIRRVYRKLIAWKLYEGPNPTEGLTLPKLDNARTRFLTHEEAHNLLAAVKLRSNTWYCVTFLSLHTGMRKSEVLKLRGEHLDFGAGRILIKNGKTGSRAVPMTPEVRDLLETLKPARAHQLLFSQRGSENTEIDSDSDASYVRAVEDCALNAGITDVRHKVVFHTLRHTFCSWLAMAGVPLFTIGELVGHSTTQMTKRYAHLCPDIKQDAAAKIGEMMRKPSHTSSDS